MGYTDFIAAIDLGTSRLTGMVGRKNASGTLTVIVAEMEPADGCIRRGCVYNVEETAARISRLIRKMNDKLDGTKIARVYIGIGGQSVRSVDHTVSRELGSDGVVTKELIEALNEEAGKYRPELADVLTVTSPVYLLDGRQEANPVGIPCAKIAATYKLIAARLSLRRYATIAVTEKSKMEIAGICVSPLALADVVLGKDEKALGCALIDFGAGVTKVSVYKGGKLKALHVIPLGGNVVTKDIMSLQVVEAEAERLKIEYGSAIADLNDSGDIRLFPSEGAGQSSIKQIDLNVAIEARIREIMENVVVRLEAILPLQELAGGIFITGGASELKGFHRALKERMGVEVRYAKLRRDLLDDGVAIEDHPGYISTLGLLMQGTVNCAPAQPKAAPAPDAGLFPVEEVEAVTPPSRPVPPEPAPAPKPEQPAKTPKTGFFRKIKNNMEGISKDLFSGEE